MNLLLLLSALLSVLSGVGSAARPVEATAAVAQGAAFRAVALPARDLTRRPQQALASLCAIAAATTLPTPVLAPVPLWMGRRRE